MLQIGPELFGHGSVTEPSSDFFPALHNFHIAFTGIYEGRLDGFVENASNRRDSIRLIAQSVY